MAVTYKHLCIPLGISLAVAFIAVKPYIPLTHDEVANYTNISSKGIYKTVTNYDFPNNHVFFSVIQAIVVHKNMLQLHPPLLRMGNVLVVFVGIVFLYGLFTRFSKRNDLVYPLYLLFLLCSSQIVTTYLFVARGYLLGTVLSVAGIWYWGVKNRKIGLVFFALSAYTVPTFSYIWPGIWLYKAIKNKTVIKVIVDALSVSSMTAFLYLPILTRVLTEKEKWAGFLSIPDFFSATFLSITNFGNMLVSIGTLLMVLTLTLISKRQKVKTMNLFLLSSVISYVAVVIIGKLVHFANLPFTRNGSFIPFFIMLSMILLIPSLPTKAWRVFIYLFLLVNTGVGVGTLYTYVVYKNTYGPITMLTPIVVSTVPKQTLLNAKTVLYPTWIAAQGALYYANIYNLHIQKTDRSYNHCTVGTIVPSESQKLILVDKNGNELFLCY